MPPCYLNLFPDFHLSPYLEIYINLPDTNGGQLGQTREIVWTADNERLRFRLLLQLPSMSNWIYLQQHGAGATLSSV